MQPTRTPRTTALMAVGIVAALVLGLAGGWLVSRARVSELEDRIVELEDRIVGLQNAAGTPGTAEATASASPSAAGETPAEEPAEEPTDGGTSSGAGGVTERQPGLITGVATSGSGARLTIDYVQFLTGDAAADAATAHGDESPPPNDYYVVNDNPRIRDFPIRAGITVRVVIGPSGGSVPEGRDISLAEWIAAMRGPDAGAYKANVYWIDVTDGVVTSIEQQYVP